MAGREERRSYIVLRFDDVVLHSKPITVREALWLGNSAYASVIDRALRVRYLEEYGNVLDAREYLGRLEQLDTILYYNVRGIYGSLDAFRKSVGSMAAGAPSQVRRALEEFADVVVKFAGRPVEPRPIEAPVRYLERLGRFVSYTYVNGKPMDVLEAEWCAHVMPWPHMYYGVCVVQGSFWLWKQNGPSVRAVAVRRDVSDEEIGRAVLSDEVVQGFLVKGVDPLEEVVSRNEERMRAFGYEDVARKAKIVLTIARLLAAGRREEVPA